MEKALSALKSKSNKVYGKYKAQELLGEGRFATVYKATDPNNREYALKISSEIIDDIQKAQLQEAHNADSSSLSKLNHPNVIKFYDAFYQEDRKCFVQVLELAEHNSYRKFLRDFGQIFTEQQLELVLVGLIQGLSHLHSNNILHKDLRIDNILIDKNLNFKISDFGKAKQCISDSHKAQANKGPICLAPESYLSNEFTERSDIYQLGLACCEIGSLPAPHHTAEYTELLESSKLDELQQYLDKAIKNPTTLYSKVVAGFLKVNPQERMSLEDALKILGDQVVKKAQEEKQCYENSNELKELREENNNLKNNIYQLRNMLDKQDRCNTDAQNEAHKLRDALKASEDRLSQIYQELNNRDKQMKILQDELNCSQREKDQMKCEIQEMKARHLEQNKVLQDQKIDSENQMRQFEQNLKKVMDGFDKEREEMRKKLKMEAEKTHIVKKLCAESLRQNNDFVHKMTGIHDQNLSKFMDMFKELITLGNKNSDQQNELFDEHNKLLKDFQAQFSSIN